MSEETRSQLHKLLDQLIDENQQVGMLSYSDNQSCFDAPIHIKTYKLFLYEKDDFFL